MKKKILFFALAAISIALFTVGRHASLKGEPPAPSTCLYLAGSYGNWHDSWAQGQCFRRTEGDWWVCEGYTSTCFGGYDCCSDYDCKGVSGCKEISAN